MTTNFTWLSRFLCFCSGADLKTLDTECPSEINKYSAIGGTVLMTGIFAFISSSYALYRVFLLEKSSILIALTFGVLWGLMIFNLDRYVVMSMRKDGRPWREFLAAFPRLIIAALISLVIAKPLEVRLFEDRIQRQIFDNKMNVLGSDMQKADNMYGQSTLAEKLKGQEKQLDDLSKNRNQDSSTPAFEDLLQRTNTQEKNKNTITNKNQAIINKINSDIIGLLNKYGIERDSRGHIQGNVPIEIQGKLQQWYEERRKYRDEIKYHEAEYNKLMNEVRQQREKHIADIDSQTVYIAAQKDKVENEKTGVDSSVNSVVAESMGVNSKAYTNNFITQIEALGNLIEKDKTLKKTSWLIMLLFFMIETAPVFVKLISKKGLYEEMLAASNELELAKQIEEKNTAFAINQSQQEELIRVKSELLKKGLQKYTEAKENELVHLSDQGLNDYFKNISNPRSR